MRTFRIVLAGALAAIGVSIIGSSPAVAVAPTIGGFTQCTNGGTGTGVVCTDWTNGAIQGSNSHFTEDQVVPQRVELTLPADNATHSLTFTYQDRKGSVHAYDSLATWNYTVTGANPCQNLAASICAGTPSTLSMTSDPAPNVPPVTGAISPAVAAHELTAANSLLTPARQWVMYGGTLVSDVAATHSSATPSGTDDTVTVTVSFKNPNPGSTSSAILLFGGHLAVGSPATAPRSWGTDLGASSVSGGPYAFKLEKSDTTTIGGKSNSIQAGSAIDPLPAAAFTITKKVTPTTGAPGDPVTYTVTVTNTGGMAASATFTDDYNDGLTNLVPPASGCTNNSPATGQMTCTATALAGGASRDFVYTANLPGSFSGTAPRCNDGSFAVTNTATFANGTTLTSATSGTASATVCVNAASKFEISKKALSLTAGAGDTVNYEVTVKNTGSAPGAATFTEDYDNNATFVGPVTNATCTDASTGTAPNVDKKSSCTTVSINAGESVIVSYALKMPTSFTGGPSTDCTNGGYKVINTVTITGVTPSSAFVCVTASPKFEITKKALSLTAGAGDTVNYEVTVKNTGSAPGAATFTEDYDNNATFVGPVTNATCTDASTGTAPNVDKKSSCTTASLDPGQSVIVTYALKMPSSFTGSPSTDCTNGGYKVVNTVTITGVTPSSAFVCVTGSSKFEISKKALSLTAGAGDTVNYEVTVKNTGSTPGAAVFLEDYDNNATFVGPVTNATCTDASTGTAPNVDKKSSCTSVSLDPGQSVIVTYALKMPSSFTGGPTLTCTNGGYAVVNTVTITGVTPSSATVCVTASSKFTIAKTAKALTAGAGDTVNYEVLVTNTGSAPGSAVFLEDYDNNATFVGPVTNATCVDASTGTAPNVDKKSSCTSVSLDPGQSVIVTYALKMPSSFTGSPSTDCSNGGYQVVNTVTITGVTPSSATVCVTGSPKFTIAKKALSATSTAGGTVNYEVLVTNTGSAPGAATFIEDYDDSATFVGPVTNATCTDASTGTAPNVDKKSTCTSVSLDPGQSVTVTYALKMPPSFTGSPSTDCTNGGYKVVNTVTITGVSPSSASVCVTASPKFTTVKTAKSLTAGAGDNVDYDIVVTNTGSAPGAATFIEDYDNSATFVGPAINATCTDASTGTAPNVDKKSSCTTASLDPGQSVTVTYTLKMPTKFTGDPSRDCSNGGYQVVNTVTVTGSDPSSATVCVEAAPAFTITKTPRTSTAEAGGEVVYVVQVSNEGSKPGSTSFTDNYPDDVSVVELPENCADSSTTDPVDKKFTCTTGEIDPDDSENITYTLRMPPSFTGFPSENCSNGGYAVVNNVTITGSSTASARVCVAASPALGITKTGTVAFEGNDQIITYTIGYKNTGTAEANGVTVTDDLPAGTSLSSCNGCTQSGSTVTWQIGSVAPLTGQGSVQLKLKVTTNQTCTITNTAKIRIGGSVVATSDPAVVNVTPQPDPSTAKSNGSAIGLQIKAKGLLQLAVGLLNVVVTGNGNNQVMTVGQTSSSQTGPGGPTLNEAHLLTLNLAGIVSTGIIRETSASVVATSPAETRQTSTSEVAGVCLVPVAGVCTVKADVVRAVASTSANGSYATASAAGSTITNLRVANTVVPVDLSQTTKIPLNAVVFGSNSYVAINEQTSSSGLVSGKYVANMSVSMIHVKITNLALVGALEIYLAQATAHSEFVQTLVCSGGIHNQSVSGHAYAAKLFTGPLLADLLLGYVQISPLGGEASQHIVGAVIPRYGVAVNAQVADTSTAGTFDASSSSARSWAEVAGDGTQPLCVLSYVTDCVAKATLIRSEARSAATVAGSVSTDTGTSLVGLKVLGIPIPVNVDPNTTIALPGIGFIILNEQFCDNGAAATHSCSSAGHSGITVRAVRVVITVANNILNLSPGVELIVAEAHADSTFS